MNLLPSPEGICFRCGCILAVDLFMVGALRCTPCHSMEDDDEYEEI